MKNRTYRYFKGEPLFPFGYGLSYTTFNIDKAKIIGTIGKDAYLSFTIKNEGSMSGTEIVQLYIRSLDDTEGPIKSLKGFKRVELKPGESKIASIDLPKTIFEHFDPQTNAIRVVPGKYEILYGSSSMDKDLKRLITYVK